MPPKLDPIHPGEILLEEFIRPLEISQNQLARDIDVPVSRVAAIVGGHRAITADTALRLGAYLGTSAEMWLRLQNGYDLRMAEMAGWSEIKKRIRAQRPRSFAAAE